MELVSCEKQDSTNENSTCAIACICECVESKVGRNGKRAKTIAMQDCIATTAFRRSFSEGYDLRKHNTITP